MNIVDMQRRSDALQRRYAILEHQRAILAALSEAAQHLWSQGDYEERCRDLQRAVSKEVVRTCWQIWDLSGPLNKDEVGVASEPEKKEPDDLPF